MVFGMIADAGGVHIEESDEDILGLRDLFPELDPDGGRGNLSGEEIDAIADRVIQRLSVEVIEGHRLGSRSGDRGSGRER